MASGILYTRGRTPSSSRGRQVLERSDPVEFPAFFEGFPLVQRLPFEVRRLGRLVECRPRTLDRGPAGHVIALGTLLGRGRAPIAVGVHYRIGSSFTIAHARRYPRRGPAHARCGGRAPRLP